MDATTFTPLFAGLVGACAGSFVATAALRSLRGEQALVGRSRCDSCGMALGFVATTPILAYATFGGVCQGCRTRIDPSHLAAEIAGASVAASAFWLAPPAPAALISLIGLMLAATAIIDQKSHRLPDKLTLTIALLSLALAVVNGRFLLGIAAGAGTFLLLEGLRRGCILLRGHPGLGAGDVKLFSALSVWLGLGAPWAMTIAAAVGLIILLITRPGDGRIAFGAPISLAAMIVGLAMQAGFPTGIWGLA